MDIFSVIAPLTGLLLLLGALFNFSVIKPLNAAIAQLGKAIEQLQKQLQEVDDKRQAQAERLSAVEMSTKSAHHRIDSLEGRIKNGIRKD